MSRRMFSSANPRRSSQRVAGLVTSFEAALTPALDKTRKIEQSTTLPTDHSQRTQPETEEEEEMERFDSIFMSVEDERRVQSLLEFARQGKISQSNAFEVPLTVLDVDLLDVSLRFWKFASELLSVSIGIYDKRVEYMFQAAHRALSNFLRAKDGEVEEEPVETLYCKSRRKKCETMRKEMAELMECTDSMAQIGRQTLEEPSKITIKHHIHFGTNPLFQRMLQAFDSNSLASLFLNRLEVGHEGRLSFFSEAQHKLEPNEDVRESFEECRPEIVERQLPRLAFVARNASFYTHISHYLRQNGLNDDSNNHLDLTQEFLSLKTDGLDASQQPTELSSSSSQQEQFSFHFVPQPTDSLDTQSSNGSQLVRSEQCLKEFFHIQDDWSVLAPTDLEFRGLKLSRRRNIKSLAVKAKRKATQADLPSDPLPFDYQTAKETREEILQLCLPSEQARNDRPYQEKFLLPRSMHPFLDIYRRRNAWRPPAAELPLSKEPERANDAPGEAVMGESTRLEVQQQSGEGGSWMLEEQLSTEGLRNMRTFGLSSIREIKEQIRGRLGREESLLLSELSLPISPGSAFIVLLHLVNEHNLQIDSADCERDVSIRL